MSALPNMHGAVDLGAKHQMELQREALSTQALAHAGLICPCGQRIRGAGVQYFVLGEVQQGPRIGMQVRTVTCCRKSCPGAQPLEDELAVARRDVASGAVTWLDEKRKPPAEG